MANKHDAVQNVGSGWYDGGLAPPPATNDRSVAVTRDTVAEYLLKDRRQSRACATLPCTLTIWVLFVTVVWMHSNVDSSYLLRTSVYNALNDVEVVYTPVGEAVPRSVKLATIRDTSEVWTWLSQGFVPALGGTKPGGFPAIRTFNRVIGEVMVRQRRVKKTTCKVGKELADFYGLPCYNEAGETATDPFGIMPYAAQDSSFIAGAGLEDSGGASLSNQDRFISWLDTRRPGDGSSPRALQTIAGLYLAGWIDDATVSVQLHVALFNGEVGAYVHVLLEFSFQRGGLVERKLHVRPLFAVTFPHIGYIILDIVWALLMLVVFLMALQNMADAKRSGVINRCCGDFWLVVDWLGTTVGFGLVIFLALFGTRLDRLSERLVNVPNNPPERVDDLPINATLAERSAAVDSLRGYHGHIAGVIGDLDWLARVNMLHRLSMFWYVTIVCIRFFRAFAGQPRLLTIGRTVGRAASDVMHLGIVLLVVFANFVVGGCILFGSELVAWSSFTYAMRSTFAVVFGNGDFTEMYDIMPIAATTWLFTFVLSVVFVLHNMMIAIIIDFHIEVQHECGGHEGVSLIAQMREFTSRVWWSLSYTLRVAYRFLKWKGPSFIMSKLPHVNDEPWRVLQIPFDIILANLGVEGYEEVDGADKKLQALPGYLPVDERFFMHNGLCDVSTAANLMQRCRNFAETRTPDTYPPESLRKEFDYSMGQAYDRIDGFKEELSSWVYEKVVACKNMEPRQRKLQSLSEEIQPAVQTPRDVAATGWEWRNENSQLALEAEPHEGLEDGENGGQLALTGGEDHAAIWPTHEHGELVVASTNMPRALAP
eukprot:TRINITY_DN67334_c0_g1_i1.p1 TRINITY_DN67334_c0_g1~~TRINITY_DN67334_c0_g1_i1.p1  ORF type:complete len:823 (-),score=97.25 TRINITY_DN67334_c0_g1_i1:463-2931(-)